jgi:hypothetical protein
MALTSCRPTWHSRDAADLLRLQPSQLWRYVEGDDEVATDNAGHIGWRAIQ